MNAETPPRVPDEDLAKNIRDWMAGQFRVYDRGPGEPSRLVPMHPKYRDWLLGTITQQIDMRGGKFRWERLDYVVRDGRIFTLLPMD